MLLPLAEAAVALRHVQGPRLASHTRPRSCVRLAEGGSKSGDDLPESEDVSGAQFSTDWDEDWRKFQREGVKSWRPEGRSAYSQQELAAARARKVVTEAKSAVPTPYELVRDTRFWFALLILAAVIPALYTVFNQQSTGTIMV